MKKKGNVASVEPRNLNIEAKFNCSEFVKEAMTKAKKNELTVKFPNYAPEEARHLDVVQDPVHPYPLKISPDPKSCLCR